LQPQRFIDHSASQSIQPTLWVAGAAFSLPGYDPGLPLLNPLCGFFLACRYLRYRQADPPASPDSLRNTCTHSCWGTCLLAGQQRATHSTPHHNTSTRKNPSQPSPERGGLLMPRCSVQYDSRTTAGFRRWQWAVCELLGSSAGLVHQRYIKNQQSLIRNLQSLRRWQWAVWTRFAT
jgi:hypothetical protein